MKCFTFTRPARRRALCSLQSLRLRARERSPAGDSGAGSAGTGGRPLPAALIDLRAATLLLLRGPARGASPATMPPHRHTRGPTRLPPAACGNPRGHNPQSQRHRRRRLRREEHATGLPPSTAGAVVRPRRSSPPAETTAPGGPRGRRGGRQALRDAVVVGPRAAPPRPPSERLGFCLWGAREQEAARAFSRFASPLAEQGGRRVAKIRRRSGPGRAGRPPRKASLPRGSGMCPQAATSAAGGRRAASRAPGTLNVCRLLTRRAHGFYARDAGVVHRKNLGLLRKLMCQVRAVRAGAGGAPARPGGVVGASARSPRVREGPGSAG